MEEFDIELIVEELSKVIDRMVVGKVSGSEGIFFYLN